MSIATQCKFFGHIITIEKALAVRNATLPKNRHTLHFECLQCGNAVRPHVAGDRCAAHFVHLVRNPECHFAEPARIY